METRPTVTGWLLRLHFHFLFDYNKVLSVQTQNGLSLESFGRQALFSFGFPQSWASFVLFAFPFVADDQLFESARIKAEGNVHFEGLIVPVDEALQNDSPAVLVFDGVNQLQAGTELLSRLGLDRVDGALGLEDVEDESLRKGDHNSLLHDQSADDVAALLDVAQGNALLQSACEREGLPDDAVDRGIVLNAHQQQHVEPHIDLHEGPVQLGRESGQLVEGLENDDLCVGQDEDKGCALPYKNRKVLNLLALSQGLARYFLDSTVTAISQRKYLDLGPFHYKSPGFVGI